MMSATAGKSIVGIHPRRNSFYFLSFAAITLAFFLIAFSNLPTTHRITFPSTTLIISGTSATQQSSGRLAHLTNISEATGYNVANSSIMSVTAEVYEPSSAMMALSCNCNSLRTSCTKPLPQLKLQELWQRVEQKLKQYLQRRLINLRAKLVKWRSYLLDHTQPLHRKSFANKSLESSQNASRWVLISDSDHEVELTEQQYEVVDEAFRSPLLQNPEIKRLAKETGVIFDRYFVYRYFEATDWIGQYNGVSVPEAVRNTILWRHSFGIFSRKEQAFEQLLRTNVVYTQPFYDREGRCILTIKLGRLLIDGDLDHYLKLFMYTVERYLLVIIYLCSGYLLMSYHDICYRSSCMSTKCPKEKFVTILDFSGFRLSNAPLLALVRDMAGLMKSHYPLKAGSLITISYRIRSHCVVFCVLIPMSTLVVYTDNMFFVNTSPFCAFLFRFFTPVIPKKILKRINVVTASETNVTLARGIGLPYLEEAFGGPHKELDLRNDQEYRLYLQRRLPVRLPESSPA